MAATREIWNNQTLKMPPVCTCTYESGEINLGEVQPILRILQHALSTLLKTEEWNSEKFVLSRLLFKLRNSSSMGKWYKGLKKVEHCMKRFHSMGLAQHLSTLQYLFERGCRVKAQEATSLPSRQLVEFVLVKLMGAAQLLRQAAGYCVDTYKHVTGQLSLGHFVHTMLLLAALVSRIWVMSRSLVLHMCRLYDSLRHLQGKLKGTQVQWLPTGCEALPDKLMVWLEETQQQVHADIITSTTGDSTTSSKLDSIFSSLQMQNGDSLGDLDLEGQGPSVHNDTEDMGVSLDEHKTLDRQALVFPAVKVKKKKQKNMDMEETAKPSQKCKLGMLSVTQSTPSVIGKKKKQKRKNTASIQEISKPNKKLKVDVHHQTDPPSELLTDITAERSETKTKTKKKNKKKGGKEASETTPKKQNLKEKGSKKLTKKPKEEKTTPPVVSAEMHSEQPSKKAKKKARKKQKLAQSAELQNMTNLHGNDCCSSSHVRDSNNTSSQKIVKEKKKKAVSVKRKKQAKLRKKRNAKKKQEAQWSSSSSLKIYM